MKRTLIFMSSLIVFISTFYLLFIGSNVLTKPLIVAIDMPAGTVISWLGIISFQIINYLILNKKSKIKAINFYKIILKGGLLLAFFWGFTGRLLAGNWAFNFSNENVIVGSEKAASIFWSFSFLLFIFPITVIIVYALHSLILFVKKKQFSFNN